MALREGHPWVAIVGQSVGGALALDAAATDRQIGALVLLAPWVAMPSLFDRLARASAVWGPFTPYLPSLGGHSIHDPIARSKALTQGLVTPEIASRDCGRGPHGRRGAVAGQRADAQRFSRARIREYQPQPRKAHSTDWDPSTNDSSGCTTPAT